MTEVLQVGNRIITAAEIIPLLVEYQMLPQLIREALVDQAIAPITCTPRGKSPCLPAVLPTKSAKFRNSASGMATSLPHDFSATRKLSLATAEN